MSARRLGVVCQKTKLCKYYASNLCRQGQDCSFAHSEEELVSAPDLRCTKMCPAVVKTGVCHRAGCKFAHDRRELRKVVFEQVTGHTVPLPKARAPRVSQHAPPPTPPIDGFKMQLEEKTLQVEANVPAPPQYGSEGSDPACQMSTSPRSEGSTSLGDEAPASFSRQSTISIVPVPEELLGVSGHTSSSGTSEPDDAPLVPTARRWAALAERKDKVQDLVEPEAQEQLELSAGPSVNKVRSLPAAVVQPPTQGAYQEYRVIVKNTFLSVQAPADEGEARKREPRAKSAPAARSAVSAAPRDLVAAHVQTAVSAAAKCSGGMDGGFSVLAGGRPVAQPMMPPRLR